MRRTVSILLLLTLLLNLVSKLTILVNYQIKQEAIASNFCENISVEVFDCNGRCYLSKSLKKTESHSSESLPEVLKEIKEVISYDETSYPFDSRSNKDALENYSSWFSHYKYLFASSCFHPPQV
ncbi:hypothetical protein RCC89_02515 [Cytophagaceae bacterium ABcell3]|nr:hypothetical protein RCC89_02515 [Cytophagaceae bacterium ABcell3]